MVAVWLVYLYHGFIFTIPAFFANSVPVYVGGLGRIDGGRNFRDGKPLLGSHKTNGGLIGGILSGGLAGMALPYFFPEIFANVIGYQWWLGFVLGFGALLGDAIGSFFKRRTSIKAGQPFPVMDQVGFIIIAFALAAIFVDFPFMWVVILTPATLGIHFVANVVAYLMGWKDVWW